MPDNLGIGKKTIKIISTQQSDGSWGYFHTLYSGNCTPYTTEQAMKCLEKSGFSIEDECIKLAVNYMSDCLTGRADIPDRKEKSCDWDVFHDLMLATWIRRFTGENEAANSVAALWARIITKAFAVGEYSHTAYLDEYKNVFGKMPKGGRLIDFVSFYQISLLTDMLDDVTESKMFDYILHHESGIYYTYEKCIAIMPENLNEKNMCRYFDAINLLARYKRNAYKLKFATDWLKSSIM